MPATIASFGHLYFVRPLFRCWSQSSQGVRRRELRTNHSGNLFATLAVSILSAEPPPCRAAGAMPGRRQRHVIELFNGWWTWRDSDPPPPAFKARREKNLNAFLVSPLLINNKNIHLPLSPRSA